MTWVQGDSNESTLTPLGEEQAKRTAAALSRMQFDRCACHLRLSSLKGMSFLQGNALQCKSMHPLGAAHINPKVTQPSVTQKMLRLDQEVLLLCSCYTSPIKRAARFAELAWGGRQAPLLELPTLKEAHLGWLQGMRQGRACLQLFHISVPLSAALQS